MRAQSPARSGAANRLKWQPQDEAFSTTLSLDNGGMTLENAKVALATLDPAKAFGGSAFGPLKFRVIVNGAAGDWQPLATLVRLPELQNLKCPAGAEDAVPPERSESLSGGFGRQRSAVCERRAGARWLSWVCAAGAATPERAALREAARRPIGRESGARSRRKSCRRRRARLLRTMERVPLITGRSRSCPGRGQRRGATPGGQWNFGAPASVYRQQQWAKAGNAGNGSCAWERARAAVAAFRDAAAAGRSEPNSSVPAAERKRAAAFSGHAVQRNGRARAAGIGLQSSSAAVIALRTAGAGG